MSVEVENECERDGGGCGHGHYPAYLGNVAVNPADLVSEQHMENVDPEATLNQSAARIAKLKRGECVTYGPFCVMTINQITPDLIHLEDPFHPRRKYPIVVKREDFDKIQEIDMDFVKSEYKRMNVPLPKHFQCDDKQTEPTIQRDREELLRQIREGISTLVGAKRTTAIIRRNLGKWFLELAETYGGELKKAVREFQKQRSGCQMPSYSTIQAWTKFYCDFKDTPEDELPTTRDEARKANPAWRWSDKTYSEVTATNEGADILAFPCIAGQPREVPTNVQEDQYCSENEEEEKAAKEKSAIDKTPNLAIAKAEDRQVDVAGAAVSRILDITPSEIEAATTFVQTVGGLDRALTVLTANNTDKEQMNSALSGTLTAARRLLDWSDITEIIIVLKAQEQNMGVTRL